MEQFEPFDRWADDALERLRGNKVADVVFTTASELGDFSLIWHLTGAARGVMSEARAAEAMVFSALMGLESLVVNQGIKRLFRRTRPTEAGDPRYEVRKPSTSAFPSGHASSSRVTGEVARPSRRWRGKRAWTRASSATPRGRA